MPEMTFCWTEDFSVAASIAADVSILNGIPISACSGGHIKLWDIASGQAILNLDSPRAVYALDTAPQQKTGTLGTIDGRLMY